MSKCEGRRGPSSRAKIIETKTTLFQTNTPYQMMLLAHEMRPKTASCSPSGSFTSGSTELSHNTSSVSMQLARASEKNTMVRRGQNRIGNTNDNQTKLVNHHAPKSCSPRLVTGRRSSSSSNGSGIVRGTNTHCLRCHHRPGAAIVVALNHPAAASNHRAERRTLSVDANGCARSGWREQGRVRGSRRRRPNCRGNGGGGHQACALLAAASWHCRKREKRVAVSIVVR